MRLFRSAAVAATAVALMTVTACTTSDSATEASTKEVEGGSGNATTSDETYKIGLALPFTGPAAAYGEEFRLAVEMGIKDANAQFADDGITLELESADTQATAEGGVSAMNKLGAVEKAPAVITAFSAVVAATAPVAEDLGVAIFNPGAQSPTLVGASPNLVNTLPMNDEQLTNYTDFLVNTEGHKKFALIYVDNESGQGTATAFKAAVEKLGGEVVAEESIRQDATDATTQVAKVKESGADFLYVQTLLVEGAATMKAVGEAGLDIPVGSYAAFGESTVIRDAGKDAMNGMQYMSQIPEDIEGVKALLDQMGAEDPDQVIQNPSYDPYFYAVPFLYAEAIKQLREDGAPVTGTNVLAVLGEADDLSAPIVGPVDLSDRLTYRGPTIVREIEDYQANSLEDTTVDTVSAAN